MDLDFIKYSLADESIKLFVDRLNLVNDGINILIDSEIEKLHHQDYNGKQVNVILKDENNFSVSAKTDIGVHIKNIWTFLICKWILLFVKKIIYS